MAARFGEQALEARRRAENSYRQMDAAIAQDRRTYQMANFENTTTQKIERRTKQQLFQQKRSEYEEKLQHRRQQLAALYNAEMNEWRDALLARVETPEDRKQKIMERAYALRDAREKARREVVAEKYAQQWRDSCDDARTLDSKATELFMNEERLKQIQQKIDRKANLSNAESEYFAEWNRQLDELERRDREKRETRERIDRETSEAIRSQIDENHRKRADYYHNKLQEDLEELARLRKEIEEDENAQRRRLEESHRLGRDVMEFNIENKRVRDMEAMVEKEQDAVLLEYAIMKERAQIAAEEAKRNANRESSLQYQRYLEEQMIKEREDMSYLDDVMKREEERVWKEREDALQAREDARNYLMKMVDEGRQEQIRHREHELRLAKEEEQVFAKRFQDENRAALQRERDEAERRRRIALDNNEQLMRQMELRKQREELERQEAFLADKQMQYREKLHKQRLGEQAGTVRLNYPLQKNNWYS